MQKKPDIESIFRERLDQQLVEPSPEVLNSLRRKLFISDFFSLNFRKLNVVYLGLAVLSIALVPTFFNNDSQASELAVTAEANSDIAIAKDEIDLISNEVVVEQEASEELAVIEEKLVSYFNMNAQSGCEPLTVEFNNQSENARSYNWNFGTGDNSLKKNPVYTFRQAGTYTVKLIATSKNGVQSEYNQKVVVYEKPTTSFNVNVEASDVNARKVFFENKSKNASKYKWSFGDQTFSEEVSPTHVYNEYKTYNVSMVAISDKGCSDTTSYFNSFVAENYSLVFPKKFEPNLAGINNGAYDRPENAAFVFYPRNHGADNYSLSVNNPNGVEIFKTNNIKQGWNGYINGRVAAPGKYNYSASGIYPNGQAFKFTGTFSVVVDQSYNDYYDN